MLANFRAKGRGQVLAHRATHLGPVCSLGTSSHPGLDLRQWEPGSAQSWEEGLLKRHLAMK